MNEAAGLRRFSGSLRFPLFFVLSGFLITRLIIRDAPLKTL